MRAAAAQEAPPPTHTASAAKHWPSHSSTTEEMEMYLKGMKEKEEGELNDALADFEEIEGARIQMDFE